MDEKKIACNPDAFSQLTPFGTVVLRPDSNKDLGIECYSLEMKA